MYGLTSQSILFKISLCSLSLRLFYFDIHNYSLKKSQLHCFNVIMDNCQIFFYLIIFLLQYHRVNKQGYMKTQIVNHKIYLFSHDDREQMTQQIEFSHENRAGTSQESDTCVASRNMFLQRGHFS